MNKKMKRESKELRKSIAKIVPVDTGYFKGKLKGYQPEGESGELPDAPNVGSGESVDEVFDLRVKVAQLEESIMIIAEANDNRITAQYTWGKNDEKYDREQKNLTNIIDIYRQSI